MSGAPRVFSIPPGVPFLAVLADALLDGDLVPGFRRGDDPLALAGVTIYVPTRRAARALRAVFVERLGGQSAILPVIRPLGEFDDDEALFSGAPSDAFDLAPPIPAIDRLLLLAPLVRDWKRRLPAHVAAMFNEDVVVPASTADALWLSRDLAALMDAVETEGSDWTRLGDLVPADLSGWWQVTRDFLEIVTRHWPDLLAERGLSNPGAHRDAVIRREAERLRSNPPAGPMIAAGSTGSIPATAALLSSIARLPRGAVVLPGLDCRLDAASWTEITALGAEASVAGHPQFGLAKLLTTIGLPRQDVMELGVSPPDRAARAALLGEALRPAETTDRWAEARVLLGDDAIASALGGVTLIEAANEHAEAAAIAVALRLAVERPGATAALVTADRELARRVSAELLRFGIRADDSGGTPLSHTPPAGLLRLMLEAAFRPGDPVCVLALLKHPLLCLSLDRPVVRRAAETIELVALRGGTGRPDIHTLGVEFENRLGAMAGDRRASAYVARLNPRRIDAARHVIERLVAALAPLAVFRDAGEAELSGIIRATVVALEGLARSANGGLDQLYADDAGEKLAELLRGIVASTAPLTFPAREWPDVVEALIATETVKPAPGADRAVAIWGTLEARLQGVDTLVLGGLNEGSWPRKPETDRLMSRLMKTGIGLEPPERRIGLAAHDFQMAMGAARVVLSRSARSGDAPSVASRWLRRLITFAGPDQSDAMRGRGAELIGWANALDVSPSVPFAARPRPTPPLDSRPRHFSVTEIETLRRDPYAIYARKILGLRPIEPLVRDPGAAERGTLFHAILNRFSVSGVDPLSDAAPDALLQAAVDCFRTAGLPVDVQAIWWPRFRKLMPEIIGWERSRADQVASRAPEARAQATPVGDSGVTLSGYADRVDLLPAGMADILDYKTGAAPSKAQAHTLLAPQLALEGALLRRGGFTGIGRREPADLAFVRLKPNGQVVHESILELNRKPRSAPELAEDAWHRLERLLLHYQRADTGYLSRAVPFREGETDGDYDHLARVLEWSAGGDGDDPAGGAE